jgi:hypothetical protein
MPISRIDVDEEEFDQVSDVDDDQDEDGGGNADDEEDADQDDEEAVKQKNGKRKKVSKPPAPKKKKRTGPSSSSSSSSTAGKKKGDRESTKIKRDPTQRHPIAVLTVQELKKAYDDGTLYLIWKKTAKKSGVLLSYTFVPRNKKKEGKKEKEEPEQERKSDKTESKAAEPAPDGVADSQEEEADLVLQALPVSYQRGGKQKAARRQTWSQSNATVFVREDEESNRAYIERILDDEAFNTDANVGPALLSFMNEPTKATWNKLDRTQKRSRKQDETEKESASLQNERLLSKIQSRLRTILKDPMSRKLNDKTRDGITELLDELDGE